MIFNSRVVREVLKTEAMPEVFKASRGILQMLMNDKIMFERCFWINSTKQNSYMLVKLVLISNTYCILMISYTPIATFQKAGTCLDAQQSMAKQPIKGCVSNHSRTCGKSVSEKSA